MKKDIIIFSAPSGAGKSTIVNHLLSKYPQLEFSISATSRAPRGTEKDGVEYYFFSTEEFEKKIAAGEFIEYEEVYKGSYYGTLRSELERIHGKGHTVVFDIDVKGGMNMKRLYPERSVSIFIMPPNVETLRKRLTGRGTDSPEAIERRVARAEEEIGYSSMFDKVIVNDVLEDSLAEAERIMEEILR